METHASQDDRSASVAETEGGGRDQRGAERLRLLMRTAKLVTSEGEFLCVLRDASITGFRARIYHSLPGDAHMELELASELRYPVEKVWEKESEAGFKFETEIALEELINELTPYPKRGVRLNVQLSTDIHVGLERARATIHNISQQGAKIETPYPLAKAQRLRLEISGLRTVATQVRWRDGDTYGLVFDDTFRFDELALLAHRLQCPHGVRKTEEKQGGGSLKRIEMR